VGAVVGATGAAVGAGGLVGDCAVGAPPQAVKMIASSVMQTKTTVRFTDTSFAQQNGTTNIA
jgi:hypothetical protein